MNCWYLLINFQTIHQTAELGLGCVNHIFTLFIGEIFSFPHFVSVFFEGVDGVLFELDVLLARFLLHLGALGKHDMRPLLRILWKFRIFWHRWLNLSFSSHLTFRVRFSVALFSWVLVRIRDARFLGALLGAWQVASVVTTRVYHNLPMVSSRLFSDRSVTNLRLRRLFITFLRRIRRVRFRFCLESFLRFSFWELFLLDGWVVRFVFPLRKRTITFALFWLKCIWNIYGPKDFQEL